MKPDIEALRKKYMDNPPEGMTSKDIRLMSEDALLDMDYFLNDDELDDDFGEEGFYIFSTNIRLLVVPADLRALFNSRERPQAVFPIKEQRVTK